MPMERLWALVASWWTGSGIEKIENFEFFWGRPKSIGDGFGECVGGIPNSLSGLRRLKAPPSEGLQAAHAAYPKGSLWEWL